MECFKNLKAIYDHIDKKALEYEFPHQIGDEFKSLRDKLQETGKENDAKRAQWEIDCFSFTIKNGNFTSKRKEPNVDGIIEEYPNMKNYDENTFLYFIERLNSTNNPFLIARYAQLLWNSPKKHTKYAKLTIDSYLQLVEIYEENDKKEPAKHFGLEILKSIKYAFYVSIQSNYRVKDTKSKIIYLIKKFNLASSSSYALKFNLIKLVLENKKIFKKEDYTGIPLALWQLSKSLLEEKKIYQLIAICELGETICQKTEKNTYRWRKRIAESYETLIKQNKDRPNFEDLFFCENAIESFRKIGDKKKVEELSSRFNEIKQVVKLANISQEIDLSDHIKQCKKKAKIISKNEPQKIIEFLMFSKDLIPVAKVMEKRAENLTKHSFLQNIMPTRPIDQSGNFSQNFDDEDEKKYYGTLQQYGFHLKFIKIPLIKEIILSAFRNKKLSTNLLLDYFKKHSWYGKNLTKKVFNVDINYNWLSLLAPSIDDYFKRLDYFFASDKLPNFILPIDSLALKIEGLIRDICRFSKIQTLHFKKDNKGRNIVQEKDLHALLYEDYIKELFKEDDLMFLKFLLVEKTGYNLRHKVAHSLMDYREYHINAMNLLILALLRIGKYDFTK